MGKIGKVTSIKKEYTNKSSLEGSLASHGFTRFPSTSLKIEVYKEANGDYRTGLNENATYLSKLPPEDRKIEQARIRELRETLELASGLDLGPKADYYRDRHNDRRDFKAELVRLKDGDNVYNLEDTWQAITYAWLRVHPLVAPSYTAYEKGEFPASTQFYINDDNVEEEIKYKKKTLINKAIVTLDGLSLERRKKVGRLLGLPVTNSSKEIFVYNILDTFIKQNEIRTGEYKGSSPVDLFNKFSTMDDKLITVRDLVSEAIKHSIYRTNKNGRITEAGQEIAKSKEDLVSDLMLDKNQEDLIALEDRMNAKRSMASN